MQVHIWYFETRSIRTMIYPSIQEGDIFDVIKIENGMHIQYEPLQRIITSPNTNNAKFPMIKKRQRLCAMKILSRTNSMLHDEIKKNTHLYKTEIEKFNNNSKRKYSRIHLEKEQIPSKEEEHNIFLTKVEEKFGKQIRDVPIF